MKTISAALTILVAAITATSAPTNTFVLPPRTYVLPLMPAPTLDGRLDPDEWPTLSICRLIESAIPTQPMTPSLFLHGRDAAIQTGCDGTNLYVAYRTSVHPQYGAICTGKRDPIKEPVRICQDDSVEMWLDPAPDSTNSVAVQIIGNCRGDTIGLFFPRGSGTNALTWPVAGFRQEHGITNGEWTAEYAIPLAPFGITNVSAPFGVRLCRTFTAPMNQCRWEAGTTMYTDPQTFCRVSFRETAPIVRETGFFDDKGMNLGLAVRNATTKPIELTVSLKGTVDGKEVGRDWTKTLKPGETMPFSVVEPIAAGQPGLCEAQMTVTDTDGTPYFTRTAKWKTPLKAQWTPVTLTRPACTTDVEFAWNPVSKSLHLVADYSGLPNKTAIKTVRWEVVSIADSRWTPVSLPASDRARDSAVHLGGLCGSGSTASSPSFRITGDLALPKLEEGEYELRVFFDGATKTETPAKALRFAHLHLLDTLAEEADAHKTAANVVTAVPRREMTESLVTNGSFEAVVNGRPGGWINSGTAAIVTNPAEAFAGANCLKLSKAANVSTRFSVERTDSYWISFRMRGTPGATFRFPFSWSYKDWVDLTATTEWKEYRLMRTYTAGVTNEVRFKVEDGKSEFFVDDVRVTPILNRLGSPFSSHMVMQRGKPIPVWGRTYFPNQTVSVEFAGRKKEAVSDANGYWRVFFKARDKGGPYTLKVSGIAEELTDIVMGDVWLCAGQSNMHFGLDNVNGLKTNAPEVAARASNDHLRLWFDPGLTAADPTREHAMMIDPKRSFGLWQRCTPETVLLPNTPGSWRGFSAVGYFFGQAIQPIAGVPVGLVEIAVGGTSAETWTSPIGIAGLDNVPLPVVDPKNLKNDTPSAYWNGTVSPVIPMPIKGILWYQGESNSGQPCWYNRVLPNLIRDWRLHFRQGDVPFYFVQICAMDSYQPFDVAWAVLRESQLRVAQSGLTNVAMAVSYDLEDEDNPWDVHPRNKKDVADRLARIALARDYGQKNVVYTGPVYREMKREGNSIRLFFDHAEGGLLGHGEHLNGFTLLDEQRRFHDATATIDGETVVVSAPGVETPAHVRYAFVQYTFPKPNLYNKTGLPASPFRTDGP